MNNEALLILAEECAEVIQILSKCQRFGIDNLNPNTLLSNRSRLEEELGDLIALISILESENIISKSAIEKAKLAKFEKLKTWSNLNLSKFTK